MIKVEFHNAAPHNIPLTYVVIVSRHNGQWVLVRHKERSTYEIPGGHIEPGEDCTTAAKRELYEETGAKEFALDFISIYTVTTDEKTSGGYLFFADIQKLAELPDYEMADTMKLVGIADNAYDFVYTSNGVHVWIDDLRSMYQNIYRILKPNGLYMLYEIHPFQRPFHDDLTIKKPYDLTGPFERDGEVTFGWRVMDIMNAILDARLSVSHIEEMFAEIDYNWPFWISCQDILNGATVTKEEVDKMHDWHNNPMAALPNWICIAARK